MDETLIADTPEKIRLYQLLVIRKRLQLEKTGRDIGMGFRVATLPAYERLTGRKFRKGRAYDFDAARDHIDAEISRLSGGAL